MLKIIYEPKTHTVWAALLILIMLCSTIIGCGDFDYVIKEFPPAQPCPDVAYVFYGDQVYETVQLGTQCWLASNLNIGKQIHSDDQMQDNGEIEKYCYLNDPALCEKYGGLYQWNEIMQYSTEEGTQGICPDGWRIPTKADFELLENYVDNRKRYLADNQDMFWGLSSSDSANVSGFAAITGGYFLQEESEFWGRQKIAKFWSSTQVDDKIQLLRIFSNNYYTEYLDMHTGMGKSTKVNGHSVRCIKNEE